MFYNLHGKFAVFIDGKLFAGYKMSGDPFIFRVDKVPVQGGIIETQILLFPFG
jgi:hypothetical protein